MIYISSNVFANGMTYTSPQHGFVLSAISQTLLSLRQAAWDEILRLEDEAVLKGMGF